MREPPNQAAKPTSSRLRTTVLSCDIFTLLQVVSSLVRRFSRLKCHEEKSHGDSFSWWAAGQHVAGVSKEEFHKVGSETKKQAKDFYRETETELAEQSAVQQMRVAADLRSLGDEFGTLAASSDALGVASDLAHQAATRASDVADRLDQRDSGSLLAEVKEFARRRPGMFITVAAVTGVLTGRLTQSVVEDTKDSPEIGTPASGSGVPPTYTSAATAPLPPLGAPRVGVNPDFGGVAR